MPQQTIHGITWNYTTYSEGGNTYASIGDGTTASGNATTDGQGLTGSVTIPNTLGGFSVRIIGNLAFHQCHSLTSVNFESGNQLETIGANAFKSSGLTSITLPASLRSIGDYTFEHCSSLTSVTFDQNSQLETIGFSTFKSSGLSGSISLPASVMSIGNSAFYQCSSLTSVNFGALILLETIGANAFKSSGLSGSITLSASVTSIGNWAFYGCSSLTSVIFESGSQLETIGIHAFRESGLTSIAIPNLVTSIGQYAFYGCSSLTSVTFDQNSQLTTIGGEAFRGSGLSGSITIPTSLTSIGAYAFDWCSSLTSVSFESGSLTANGSSIGYRAFYQSGIATVNAYSDTIDAMGWTVSDSTTPPTYNTIGNKSGITVVELVTAEIPICFPKGTPVLTNLGPVAIEKLNPDKHSIRGKEIVAITQSRPLQKHIVCFGKDALSKNVPSQQTLCSMEHKVFYKGEMTKARNLVDLCENVIFVPYNGETLFNVLLKKHDKMMINNLICETLHPENIAAKISTMKDGQKKNKAIQELTKIIKENNVPEYQKLYASL